MLLYLVPPCDAQVNLSLPNKSRNVSSGEKDERNVQVFDQGNVQPMLSSKLNVGALEQVKRFFRLTVPLHH